MIVYFKIFMVACLRPICNGHLQGAQGRGKLCFIFRSFYVFTSDLMRMVFLNIVRGIGIGVATLFLIVCVSVANIAFCLLFSFDSLLFC